MSITVLQDRLVHKTAKYRNDGFTHTQALRRAVEDLVREAEGPMSPAEVFCLKLWAMGGGYGYEDVASGYVREERLTA